MSRQLTVKKVNNFNVEVEEMANTIPLNKILNESGSVVKKEDLRVGSIIVAEMFPNTNSVKSAVLKRVQNAPSQPANKVPSQPETSIRPLSTLPEARELEGLFEGIHLIDNSGLNLTLALMISIIDHAIIYQFPDFLRRIEELIRTYAIAENLLDSENCSALLSFFQGLCTSNLSISEKFKQLDFKIMQERYTFFISMRNLLKVIVKMQYQHEKYELLRYQYQLSDMIGQIENAGNPLTMEFFSMVLNFFDIGLVVVTASGGIQRYGSGIRHLIHLFENNYNYFPIMKAEEYAIITMNDFNSHCEMLKIVNKGKECEISKTGAELEQMNRKIEEEEAKGKQISEMILQLTRTVTNESDLGTISGLLQNLATNDQVAECFKSSICCSCMQVAKVARFSCQHLYCKRCAEARTSNFYSLCNFCNFYTPFSSISADLS
jgi:hypothetical protein